MADNAVNSLRNMIMSFRVAELQMLLGFAGKQKCGKKNELQAQALELLKGRALTTSVQNKIKELHRQRYNNLSYLSNTVGNSSDSCDSDMAANYVHQVTTRSATNQSHHGLHSMSSQPSSGHLLNASNGSHMSHKQRTDYYQSMPRGLGLEYPPKPYQSMQSSMQSSMPPMQYPVYPDVVFKSLPFYDILGDLLKPSSLMPTVPGSRFQESMFTFHLTPQQANDVAMSREVTPGPKVDYTVQLQLRFCLNETTCEQEDNFPPSICVKISISWAADYNRPYAIGVFLVRKLTSQTLLQRIKQKGVRNSDHTRAMIKEKLSHDPDSEIATMSLRGSLLCPLGKMRIQIPCRAITCAHVQCFDALLYLQMNEKKPTWVCPVCDKPAVFANLAIDGLFNEIIKDAPTSCNEVQFHEDGSWTPVVAKKENSCETLGSGSRRTKNKRETCEYSLIAPERAPPKKPKIDVITIESSDEEDDDTIKCSSNPPPSTPVLSSGSGSESDTPNHMQSLPSPDSSSSASSNIQPIASNSGNSLITSYFSTVNTPTTQSVSSGANNRSTLPSSLSVSSMASSGRSSTASAYTSVPLLNQYYSSFPDFLNSGNNSLFNYSNVDMSSAFDHLFRQDREVPNYSRGRPADSDPDIISID
ncbi:unnamed protein product [Oppiella nova]|uniref:Uncharacterized protein n=1 Tax=Oppiella nova TaxID=334625 RepID=A0A7R9QC90_9ACAR|nr:unnamed protein product [Oppiella nova]CAG2162346.1 unnamed protein product [Oppiella nova]